MVGVATIKELAAVMTPDSLSAAAQRHLQIFSRSLKGTHVHFLGSRLIGDKRKPFPIGRDGRILCLKLVGDNWKERPFSAVFHYSDVRARIRL